MWTWTSIETLVQDLRYAARTLRQSPGFAVTSILALSLGIGVNTAIFTVFDEIAFRPLPIKDGDRIVGIYQTFHGRFERGVHGNIHLISYPEFLNYQAHNRVFTDIAAYADASGGHFGVVGEPGLLQGAGSGHGARADVSQRRVRIPASGRRAE